MASPTTHKPTVRAALRRAAASFLESRLLREAKAEAFEHLATTLEDYLTRVALTGLPASQAFASSLELVLHACDEPIYQRPMVAEAYAYVHLLERYRRFWDLLAQMTEAGVLPIARGGTDVLDVGTGPAPASYAVNDFYAALDHYAATSGIARLRTAAPHIDCIEASGPMNRLVHILSELAKRRGPFGARFQRFEGFDPIAYRMETKERHLLQTAEDLEVSLGFARKWLDQEEPGWTTVFTYKLCIFSNFLTTVESIRTFSRELSAVFRALRPGGVVVLMGAKAGHYPEIFRVAEELAKTVGLRRICEMPDEIPCCYSDPLAQRIKRLYLRIWSHLEERGADLAVVPPARAAEFGDASVSLKGPRSFGVRVFRKGPWSRA